MRLSVQSTFILCNFHVCKLKNAYRKDLNALRFLIDFFYYFVGLLHHPFWLQLV